jgi:hypothetical protein
VYAAASPLNEYVGIQNHPALPAFHAKLFLPGMTGEICHQSREELFSSHCSLFTFLRTSAWKIGAGMSLWY